MGFTSLFKNQKQDVVEENSGGEEEIKEEVENLSKLPVNRDYNFSEKVPSNVPDYREHQKEKTKILADLMNKGDSKQLPRYLIGGPTGSGKTHLVRAIGKDRETPVIEIQGKYSMDEADLLGSPMLIDGDTVWSDGPLTKALLASQDQEVILLIDEVNRAPPESKGILFSALDDRCRVELDGRGGEVIEGNPENLIVMATMNEGDEYHTQEMDLAEKRRFGSKWTVDYLGREHPEAEAEVVSSRTPASMPVAERLVEIANVIREATDSDDSIIQMGVPTSNLMVWARTAYAYKEEGIENPLVEAAHDAVVKPMYEGQVAKDVLETVKDHADGAPFEKEGFKNWLSNTR